MTTKDTGGSAFPAMDDAMRDRAAAAIANARIMRRGAPAISNVLSVLSPKLLAEVREDAVAAIAAARKEES